MWYNWCREVAFCYQLITWSLSIVHLLYIIFAPDFLMNFLVTIVMIVVICIPAYLMERVIIPILLKFDKSKIKNAWTTVTLGIVILLGFVPRVAVYFIQWNYCVHSSILFFFLIVSGVVSLGYWEHLQYQNHYAKWVKVICAIVIIHVVLLVASIRLAVTYENIWDTVVIIFFQVMFAPICLVANIDLVLVVITWKRGPQNQVAPLDLEATSDGGPCVECDICLLPYSTQNIPRLLKECGHTICTGCATKLLDVYKNVYLLCPSCRMATVVRGSVTRLPRNHALLGLIEEMKGKKKK